MTKNLPQSEIVITTDRAAFMDYVMKNLPSMGFGADVDTEIMRLKLDVFGTIFDLAKNTGQSFDSEILFSSFIDDLNALYKEVSPSLLLLEREKNDA